MSNGEDAFALFNHAMEQDPTVGPASQVGLGPTQANPEYLNACLETLGMESTRTALAPSTSGPEERVPKSSLASSMASKARETEVAKVKVKNSVTEIAKNLVTVNRGEK